MTNARARRNLLSKVKINGVTLIDEEEIKVGVCRTYQTLLTKKWGLEAASWESSV